MHHTLHAPHPTGQKKKCYTVNKQLRCKRTAGKKGCSRRTRDDKPANPTSKGSTNTRSACPRSKNMETCKGGRERQSKRGKRHVRSWQGCRKQTKKDVSLKAPHSPHSQWLCIPTTQYESQLAQLACIPHMHTTTSKHAGTHEHDTALRHLQDGDAPPPDHCHAQQL